MNYEILYIIPAKYSDSEIEEINKKITPILKEAGASIIKIDNWGKKKLAYQIKHFRYGYYTLIIFSAPAEALAKITEKLNLNQEVIRFQIVKEIKISIPKSKTIKKELKKEAGGEKEEKRKQRIREKADKTEDSEEKKVSEEEPKKKEKRSSSAKTTEDKKASIDDLDKKLDELLSDAV